MRVGSPRDMFCAMYAPLIVGFVVFILLNIYIGWVLERSRRRDAERDHH
jgi:hypothetical protein